METHKICSFIGHRCIENNEELETKLKELIIDLIVNQNVKTFLFGSRSQFDDLALAIVTNLKEIYTNINRILYTTYNREIVSGEYKKYLLQFYDEIYICDDIQKSGKGIYIERNKKIIEYSDICIFYYDEKYTAKNRRSNYVTKSGTRIACDYAQKLNKRIFNIKSNIM